MNLAFTYGHKFTLEDLDDPFFDLKINEKFNLHNRIQCHHQKCKIESLRRLKESLGKTEEEEKTLKVPPKTKLLPWQKGQY